MSKYYEAYDIRYRQVHEKGLTWAVDNNTELVEKVIDNGFDIVEQGITSIENHFNEIMYVIIRKA